MSTPRFAVLSEDKVRKVVQFGYWVQTTTADEIEWEWQGKEPRLTAYQESCRKRRQEGQARRWGSQ